MNAYSPICPPAEQARVLLTQRERENAAAFNAGRNELLSRHAEVRERLHADWLDLSTPDFLAKYGGRS